MSGCRECSEGYQLYLLWARAVTHNPYRAPEARKEYDEHLATCPNCNLDLNVPPRKRGESGEERKGEK